MAHVRQQIRVALVTLLNGLATSGSRVFKNRNLVLLDTELPALVITTNGEQIGLVDVNNLILERTLSINIIAKAKAAANIDDVLDTMAKEVEVRMATDPTLGGLCKDVVLSAIDPVIEEGEETPAGEIVLQYQANYYTQASAPETSI